MKPDSHSLRNTVPVSDGGVHSRVTDLLVTSFTLTWGIPGRPTQYT